jgi:hypothetical protein
VGLVSSSVSLLDRLRDLVGWLDKEDLLDAHVVGVSISPCLGLLYIFVKVDHFLDCLVKLALITHVEMISGVLEHTDLGFNNVELLSHLHSVLAVHPADLLQALFKLLLVAVHQLAVVLHFSQLLLVNLVFAPLPGVRLLLFVKVVAPLRVKVLKLVCCFESDCLKVFDYVQGHFHGLLLEVNAVGVARQSSHQLGHTYQLLLKFICLKPNFFIFFKSTEFVRFLVALANCFFACVARLFEVPGRAQIDVRQVELLRVAVGVFFFELLPI